MIEDADVERFAEVVSERRAMRLFLEQWGEEYLDAWLYIATECERRVREGIFEFAPFANDQEVESDFETAETPERPMECGLDSFSVPPVIPDVRELRGLDVPPLLDRPISPWETRMAKVISGRLGLYVQFRDVPDLVGGIEPSDHLSIVVDTQGVPNGVIEDIPIGGYADMTLASDMNGPRALVAPDPDDWRQQWFPRGLGFS